MTDDGEQLTGGIAYGTSSSAEAFMDDNSSRRVLAHLDLIIVHGPGTIIMWEECGMIQLLTQLRQCCV